MGAYEKPLPQVVADIAIGFGEGVAFGSVAKLPGWGTRVVALGAIGAGTAKIHGGGTTEMVAGAINLASLGIAGRGVDKIFGTKIASVPGEGAWGTDPHWTFFKAHEVLASDLTALERHGKPINEYVKAEGKGFYNETEGLPFELDPIVIKELVKKSKKDFELTLGNIEKLEVNKQTQKDIDSGAEHISFTRIKKEKRLEELEKGEKIEKEEVHIPRELVIKDGKFLDPTYHINVNTLKLQDKATSFEVVDPPVKTPIGTKGTKEITDSIAKRDILIERYDALNSIKGDIKPINEATIEVTYNQLKAIAKLGGKQHKWAKSEFAKVKKIKDKIDINLNKRLNNYKKKIDITKRSLNRIMNVSAKGTGVPGEHQAINSEQLINALVDIKTKDLKKDPKTGKYNELDTTGEMSAGFLKEVVANLEGYLMPTKLIGSVGRSQVLNFLTTQVGKTDRRVKAAIDDILYKSEMDIKGRDPLVWIEEKKGFLQGGIFKRFGNAIGSLRFFRSKDSALTRFENVLQERSIFKQREGVKFLKKIIDTMIDREIVMEKLARKNAKKDTDAAFKKEYRSRGEDGKLKYQMSYEQVKSQYKLNDEQLQILKNLDEGLANARIYHNNSVRENPKGDTIIPELPNYYPHAWIGAHRMYIKDPTTGKLIGSIAGSSKPDVEAQRKMFVEKHPEYAEYPMEYVKRDNLVGGARGENLMEAFWEASRIMEIENPKLSIALKEAYKEYRSSETFARVKRERKGIIGGYAGTRAGMLGLRDFMEVYKGYVSGAVRTAEAIRFKQRTDGLFDITDPRVAILHRKLPNQFKFGSKYIDNYFGRNESVVTKAADKLISTISKFPLWDKFTDATGFAKVLNAANTATLYTALLFFNTRFLISQVVQPYQMTPQRLAFLRSEFGIRGDIGKAITEGSMLTFKPTPEFLALVKKAIENGTIDQKFLNEFGFDISGREKYSGKIKKSLWRTLDMGSGKSLAGMIERHSRLNALAMVYSFLKSAKYDKTNGRKKLFRDAMRITDDIMVEYNATNRAPIFTRGGGGSATTLFGLFKTFQQNYFGQMLQYAKSYAKNPKSAEASLPLLIHMTNMVMTAGLFGVFAVNQVDSMIDFINRQLIDKGVILPKDKMPNFTEAVLLADIPRALKFGLPSELVGADISSTMAAPNVGIGDIFSAPALDYLFGLKSKTNPGVVGSSWTYLTKTMAGQYTDVDLYRFLKAVSPPIVQAELERKYSHVPIDKLLGYGDPTRKVTLQDEESIYFKSLYSRRYDRRTWVVANPFKEMRGSIERDIDGFKKRYLSGRSFEESLILKTIWADTQLSRLQKDKVDTWVTNAAHEAQNGRYDNLIFFFDTAQEMGFTYEEFMEKVINRMEYMNNTVLARMGGMWKLPHIPRSNFILDVIRNNNIRLEQTPGSSSNIGFVPTFLTNT